MHNVLRLHRGQSDVHPLLTGVRQLCPKGTRFSARWWKKVKDGEHVNSDRDASRPEYDERTVFEGLPNEQIKREAHRTYRVRKYGNRELPLPPFLDPAIHEQEMKYTKLDSQYWGLRPKFKDGFRDELRASPECAALLSPVRSCSYTGARIPGHFLERFHIYRIEDERKMGFRLHEEGGHLQDDLVSGASTYAASHPEVFAELNRKKTWHKLIHRYLAGHAANAFNMNPQSHSLNERFAYDKTMSEQIAEKHIHDVQYAFKRLYKNFRDYILDEQQALSSVRDIVVFLRITEDTPRLEVFHGLPCYHISSSDLLGNNSHLGTVGLPEVIGVARRADSIPFVLALDRYYSWNGHFLPSSYVQRYEATNAGEQAIDAEEKWLRRPRLQARQASRAAQQTES